MALAAIGLALRAAMSLGSQAFVRGGASSLGRMAPRVAGKVVTDNRLKNARDLTDALAGGRRVIPGAGGATNPKAPEGAAKALGDAIKGKTGPSPPRTRPPGNEPATPAGPRSAGKGKPDPSSVFGRASQVFHRAVEKVTRLRNGASGVNTVARTLEEQYGDLKKAGKLPALTDVARRYATPVPSQSQYVQYANEQDQKQKDEELANRPDSKGITAMKGALLLGTGTLALGIAVKAVDSFARSLLDSKRELRIFSSTIAGSYARMERTSLVLRSQLAAATGTSTGMLADSYMTLQREIAPLRQAVVTFINTGGVIIVKAATVVVKLMALLPHIQALKWIADKIEENTRKEAEGPQRALREFLGDIAKGDWKDPKMQVPPIAPPPPK